MEAIDTAASGQRNDLGKEKLGGGYITIVIRVTLPRGPCCCRCGQAQGRRPRQTDRRACHRPAERERADAVAQGVGHPMSRWMYLFRET